MIFRWVSTVYDVIGKRLYDAVTIARVPDLPFIYKKKLSKFKYLLVVRKCDFSLGYSNRLSRRPDAVGNFCSQGAAMSVTCIHCSVMAFNAALARKCFICDACSWDPKLHEALYGNASLAILRRTKRERNRVYLFLSLPLYLWAVVRALNQQKMKPRTSSSTSWTKKSVRIDYIEKATYYLQEKMTLFGRTIILANIPKFQTFSEISVMRKARLIRAVGWLSRFKNIW